MAIGYVDPNGDGATLQWVPTPAGTHYTAVDDGTRQPTAPDTIDYISYSGIPDSAIVDIYDMSSIAGAPLVTSITVWFYGNCTQPVIYADAYLAGAWVAVGAIELTGSNSWKSATVNGSWTQDDLDNLQLRIRRETGAFGVASTVHAVYAEITYGELPSGYPFKPWAAGIAMGWR